MFDLISEISQTMRNNKLRTGLTGFAVAWGIFMLIILLGLSNGIFNGFEEQSTKRDLNTIQIWSGSTTMPYKGYNKGRRIRLMADDVVKLEASGNKYIGSVMTTKYIDSAKVASETEYVANGVDGVFPQAKKNLWVDMVDGRWINRADIDGKRKSMVIGKKTAKILFKTDSAVVGRRVKALGLSWQIVGVYSREWNEDDNFIPFTTAMALSGTDNRVWSLNVLTQGVTDEAGGEEAEAAIRRELARIHNFNPDDPGAVNMWNRFTNYLQSRDGLGILNIAVWLIGIFTLLSGIVGVSNIMFVSVRERTHEIGIRRAIGAKRHQILTQIILESVSITTLFGYMGIIAGMAVMEVVKIIISGMDDSPFGNVSVNLSLALEVTAVLIVAGALAGLFPALKATKVKPVEALRDE